MFYSVVYVGDTVSEANAWNFLAAVGTIDDIIALYSPLLASQPDQAARYLSLLPSVHIF